MSKRVSASSPEVVISTNVKSWYVGSKTDIRVLQAVDNTFERLKEDLDDVLRSLLEEEPLPSDNNITVTVKTLYGGCMNTGETWAVGQEYVVGTIGGRESYPFLHQPSVISFPCGFSSITPFPSPFKPHSSSLTLPLFPLHYRFSPPAFPSSSPSLHRPSLQ